MPDTAVSAAERAFSDRQVRSPYCGPRKGKGAASLKLAVASPAWVLIWFLSLIHI